MCVSMGKLIHFLYTFNEEGIALKTMNMEQMKKHQEEMQGILLKLEKPLFFRIEELERENKDNDYVYLAKENKDSGLFWIGIEAFLEVLTNIE